MIVDFHTHIFPPAIRDNRAKYLQIDPLFAELYTNPHARIDTAEDLISVMDSQRIDKAVALNIGWSSVELCRETNDYILESVSRYTSRLIGFGMVVLNSGDQAIVEIERLARNGIKGIGEVRFSPNLLKRTESIAPAIQTMVENNLILLTHASEPVGHIYPGKGDLTPEALYPLIQAFPGLKLVCAHWGGGLPFYALMPEVKKDLGNTYFDTAASPFLYRSQIYEQVVELVGPEKILFGSDYPLMPPNRLTTQIESSNLSGYVKQQILGENAMKLLGIK